LERSKLAKDLYNLIGLYSDYIEDSFPQKRNAPDLSFFDKVEKSVEVKQVVKKEEKIVKKEQDVNILNKRKEIINIATQIIKCEQCQLCKISKIKIPGVGDPFANVMVITDFVTDEEEAAKLPLIGNTGDFFKKWMGAINLSVDDLFITHLIKCNPKKNTITKDFIEQCRIHLDKQIELIKPKLILVLGDFVLSSLMKRFLDIKVNHGKVFQYKNIPFIATFHPKDVLQNQTLKKPVWDDLKILQNLYKERIV